MRMRNGIAAIVPLFMGIVLLFMVITFMGGGTDTLFAVNKVENLQRLQAKLLIPALKKKNDSQQNGKSADVAEKESSDDINIIMSQNGY